METMHKLVERTSHLTLGSPPASGKETSIPHAAEVQESVAAFSPTVTSYLTVLYKSLIADPASKAEFLEKVQRESPNIQVVDPLASLADFQAYMASPAAAALRPAKKLDASAPITDYFISSSHNTYLTGNQLYSDAAASAYTSVLLGGCRCVEIDVWDGEPVSSDSESSSDSSSDDEDSHNKEHKHKKKDLEKEKKITKQGSRIRNILSRNKSSSEDAQPAGAEGIAAPVPNEPESTRKPEPMVLHGHTLTKGATFRDVCNAIRDSAFVVSDLPVIVSLEVHACLEQQQTMVEIMQEAWKGLLVDITPEHWEPLDMPTLQNLKRKILIKVKWVQHAGDDQAESEEALEKEKAAAQKSQDGSTNAVPPKPLKILEALSRLAVYTKGFSFRALEQPEAKIPGHVFSLSENAARETHQNDCDALFEHNRRFFMRVYPYGLRVNSSNLDPTFHWRRGAQIVALNWQNLDKGTMLNHGMFRGEPGWVLKPEGYRSFEVPVTATPRRDLDLKIEFFAGQDLILPPGDTKERGFHPYVSCCLHVEQPGDEGGALTDEDSTDKEENTYKRKIKSSAGVNPDFKAQAVHFPVVTGIVEELSFLRIKIKDDELGRDSMAAWTCIRLDRLQNGYRLLHFHDCTGWKSGGVLFVKIAKNIS